MSRESRRRAWLANQARLKARKEIESRSRQLAPREAAEPSRVQSALQSTLLWGCISTALAILIAVVAAMIHDIRWALFAAWPFAVFAVWEFTRHFSENKFVVQSITGGSVIFFVILLGRLYAALAPGAVTSTGRPLDEILPGFASGLMVKADDSTEVRRKYQFEFHTPEGAKAAFYLSASNRYAFSVTDVHGDPYTLDIPLGAYGLPFGKWAYIFCEVGTASSYSYLRAMLNGKQVARRDYDFPLDLGSSKWIPVLGADANGRNGGAFSMTEIGARSMTLTDADLMALAENALSHYGIKP
jgi:hypothetical protein